jgi:hypothetical protein
MIAAWLPHRARLSAQAIALRLRLGALLRGRSLPGLLGFITPKPPAIRPAPLPLAYEALRVAEGLLERLRIAPDTCLYRALARYAVLKSAGHPARFLMGIKPPTNTEITGHAWVELDGKPAFEAVDPDLVITFAYPARAEASARVSP